MNVNDETQHGVLQSYVFEFVCDGNHRFSLRTARVNLYRQQLLFLLKVIEEQSAFELNNTIGNYKMYWLKEPMLEKGGDQMTLLLILRVSLVAFLGGNMRSVCCIYIYIRQRTSNRYDLLYYFEFVCGPKAEDLKCYSRLLLLEEFPAIF